MTGAMLSTARPGPALQVRFGHPDPVRQGPRQALASASRSSPPVTVAPAHAAANEPMIRARGSMVEVRPARRTTSTRGRTFMFTGRLG